MLSLFKDAFKDAFKWAVPPLRGSVSYSREECGGDVSLLPRRRPQHQKASLSQGLRQGLSGQSQVLPGVRPSGSLPHASKADFAKPRCEQPPPAGPRPSGSVFHPVLPAALGRNCPPQNHRGSERPSPSPAPQLAGHKATPGPSSCKGKSCPQHPLPKFLPWAS